MWLLRENQHIRLKNRGLSVRVARGIHTLPNDCLEQAVELLMEEHKKHPGYPSLFPSPKTGGMFDPDSFRHAHKKIFKAIGAEPGDIRVIFNMRNTVCSDIPQ